MRKFTLFTLLLFFMSSMSLSAQKKVSGIVSSAEDGSAIPGVSILIKGTQTGTVSDLEGKFSLTVPDDKTVLIFSFVGKETQKITVGDKTEINVKLAVAAYELEGTVITAMGISKQEKTLGYAVSQVKSDDIVRAQPISAMNALQGKIAGVNISTASSNPGASTRVISRGFSSLTGSNQVLYVVDGIPINNSAVGSTSLNGGTDFGNGANDISPEDIESITFLKGSSATVLYGSRAANGVIQITTKKGRGLATKEKTKAEVSYTSSFFAESTLRLPTFQNQFGEGFYGYPDPIENTSWGPAFDDKIHPWGHTVNNQQLIKPYSALPTNVKDFFEVGRTFDNNLSIANSYGNTSYYFSYGNVRSDGIFPGESDIYRRNTLSLRGSAKLNNGITTSGSISYIKKQSKFVPTGQDQSVYDNILQTPRDISIVDQSDYNSTFYDLNNYYNGYAANPYYVLNEHGNNYNDDRLMGSLVFGYDFTDWMSAVWRLGTDVGNSQLKEWRAVTDYVRNDYNDDPGMVSQSTFFNREFNSDFILNFNKDFSKDFIFTGLAGWNVNQRNTEDNSIGVVGLDIPFFYNVSNSSSTPSVSNYISNRRLYGVYGQAEFYYKRFFSVTLNARNDWSSTLPSKNRSFFYPGVNTAFVFTDAFPNLKKYISFGKVRLGWSRTGNDANPYLIFATFTQANLSDGYRGLDWPLGGINAFTVGNTIGNPDLRPELTTEFEVGADLRFFQNRLGLDFTYYNKTTTDLIYSVPLAYSSGYRFQTKNLGEINNKGIEVLLRGTPIKKKNFVWEASINFSKNDNLLVSLNDDLQKVDLGGTSSIGFVAVPGMPLGVFEGSVALTDGKGHIVVDNNGLPIAATDKTYLGNGQYDWMTGISNSFSYKNLAISFSIDYRKGGLMYSRTKEIMYFAGIAPETTFNDRDPFIIPNSVLAVYNSDGEIVGYDENNIPISNENHTLYQYFDQTHGGGDFSSAWLIDKTYFKLRDVVITYNFPAKWIKKTPFGKAQISLIGRNLLLYTPSSNHFIDPEVTTFGNDLNADFGEFTAAPTTRSIGVSLKVMF